MATRLRARLNERCLPYRITQWIWGHRPPKCDPRTVCFAYNVRRCRYLVRRARSKIFHTDTLVLVVL